MNLLLSVVQPRAARSSGTTVRETPDAWSTSAGNSAPLKAEPTNSGTTFVDTPISPAPVPSKNGQ